jgi:hypothetical protein
MNFLAKAAAAALTVWGCSTAFALTEPATQGTDVSALAGQSASADALYAERWIRSERDNRGRPFAIVDKKAARIFVFAGDGRLVGSSPTLLGATRGDIAVPGSERKAPSQLLPNEQRTPAGRFHSVPGRNNFGEDVVWVDYDASIAIHRVRPGPSAASRLQSLADTLPDDKRRSLGCVVVPESFLASVVMPTLGRTPGTIYILPEEGPVRAMFAQLTPPTLAVAPAPRAVPALATPIVAATATTATTATTAPRALVMAATPAALHAMVPAPTAVAPVATPAVVTEAPAGQTPPAQTAAAPAPAAQTPAAATPAALTAAVLTRAALTPATEVPAVVEAR